MKTPLSSKGTAILVPGQYKSSYVVSKHRGQYDALCQRKPVKVYRDNNKDKVYNKDPKSIQEGLFGINIHRAARRGDVDKVNGYSAGCQVFKRASDFNYFMKLVNKSKKIHGDLFTYTLFEDLSRLKKVI